MVATKCKIFHRGGVGWRQSTVAIAHQFNIEIKQCGVARLACHAKWRGLMIAPTPMLNVNAETVDFIDLDADSVAVAGVAADLGASETFLRV